MALKRSEDGKYKVRLEEVAWSGPHERTAAVADAQDLRRVLENTGAREFRLKFTTQFDEEGSVIKTFSTEEVSEQDLLWLADNVLGEHRVVSFETPRNKS
jgi:hypothetical protein